MYSPILTPQVISNVISQQAAASEWILNLFGVNHGADQSDPLFDPDNDIVKGQNVLSLGHGRTGAFNIMDNSRRVAKGRAPGTAAAQSSNAPVGTVPFTYPRMYDSIRLLAEQFHNLGLIDNPAQRDVMGQRMIQMQTKIKAQEAANWRKAALIGALRGTLKAVKDGENVNWSFTSGMDVSAQIPSGNLNRLDMLGTGAIISASWGAATTDIQDHMNGINKGFQRLCGGALRGGIFPSNVWSKIIANDSIREVAGIANAPFQQLTVDFNSKVAVTMKNVKTFKLNSQPQATFYVTDEVLELGDGTTVPVVPDNYGLFFGFEPDDGTVAIYEGSEPVAEYDGGPKTLRTGFSSWMVERSNPTATEVYFLDNAMPVIHVPKAVAFAELIF